MTTFTVAQFKTDFNEFNAYPDTLVQKYLTLSYKLVNEALWCELYSDGIFLLTAHYLVIFNPSGSVAFDSGFNSSVVSSKSVKGVSVSFDNSIGMDAEANQYNLTVYGQQYFQLSKLLPSFIYLGY